MQLLPGVFQINGSPYGRHQNGFLVHHEGTTLLIDSGDVDDRDSLPTIERNAARWGFRLEDASHLLVTHEHFDHASHAAALQRRGVAVVASAPAADAMRAGDLRCIGWTLQRVFEPCTVDVVAEPGAELECGSLRVRCIAAPGHCEGLIIYEIVLDEERSWFVGDLILTKGSHDAVELPWTGAPDFDKEAYLRTMLRLVELPCDHLFPGHGPPALHCGSRVIGKALEAAQIEWR
jgi:metallo-beta-lactamase class B